MVAGHIVKNFSIKRKETTMKRMFKCENGNLLSIEDCLCVYLEEENRRTLEGFAYAGVSNGGDRSWITMTKTDYIRIVELYKDNGCIC